MQLKLLNKYISHVTYAVAIALCLRNLAQTPALAQSEPILEESDYSEATGPGYGEKFKEAEQALLEGLSRRPDHHSTEPVLRNASVVKPVGPETHTAQDAERALIVGKKSQSLVEPEQALGTTTPPKTKAPQSAPRSSTRESGAVIVLQKKLTASEKKAQDLERQLSETKSQLYSAEIEINRLSALVSPSSRARLNAGTFSNNEPQGRDLQALRGVTPRSLDDVVAPAPHADLQIATVVVDKADLRLGPGKNHSALMPVRRGSRLMVEVRHGEWYRVYAPNGQRAWIHSSLVRFGDGAASRNDGSSVRVQGFNAHAEQEPFRKLGSITARD